jgi:hypothetical protein
MVTSASVWAKCPGELAKRKMALAGPIDECIFKIWSFDCWPDSWSDALLIQQDASISRWQKCSGHLRIPSGFIRIFERVTFDDERRFMGGCEIQSWMSGRDFHSMEQIWITDTSINGIQSPMAATSSDLISIFTYPATDLIHETEVYLCFLNAFVLFPSIPRCHDGLILNVASVAGRGMRSQVPDEPGMSQSHAERRIFR